MKELEEEISRRRWKSECLERFVMFLRELYKYPDHYKKIAMRADLIDKDTGRIKPGDGDTVEYRYDWIKKYLDCIWGLLASFIRYDVISCDENEAEIWFCFKDDYGINKRKVIYVDFYKAEWGAEEAK